uniref:Uncharacterized protein n=1 Tax=Meloidogyne floridensis TaxID=298350 RepID=A0A915PHQ3_9BILA
MIQLQYVFTRVLTKIVFLIEIRLKIVLNSKTKKEAIDKAKSHLWFYIECVDGFFIQTKTKNKHKKQMSDTNKQPKFKGIFQLNEGSENYKNLLRSFLLTKPLYIATLMYKTLKEYDTHSFLEIVSTQKLEELKVSLKLMAVLYPNFKEIKFLDFETIKVDFNKFSSKQKEFEAEKLNHFLNWRLDINCIEKPIIEKCFLEKIEEKSSTNNDKRMVTDKLIKILILSNFVGENVTDKMKPVEKNKLVETINKTNFNLTGNVNGYSILLHLIENINEKSEGKFYQIFNRLTKNEEFSYKNLFKKSTKGEEIFQQNLSKFFSNFVQAKYFALALALKQIVKVEEEENISEILKNGNLIKLDISEEEIKKIKLIEGNFVLIENLMNNLSINEICNLMILEKIGYNKNEFKLNLEREMRKLMLDLDFKC